MTTIDKLGTVGFIADREGFELPANALSGGQNVRAEDGSLVNIKGWYSVVDIGFSPYWADWASNASSSWWVLFSQTEAFSYDGTSLTNITGTSGFNVTPGSNLHSTTKLNGILCCTDNRNPPQAIYDEAAPETIGPTTTFIDLPGWNTGETARFLIGHKNYLIAAHITTDTQVLPNAIRWSNAAAPGKLPDTWVPAADNDASEITIIGANSGSIVGLELLRDDVIIYTETGTFRLYYVGGDRIYDVRRIFRNRGMYAPRCVAEFRGRHYVITDDDVIVHDGVQAQSIADGRVRNWLNERLTDDNKDWVFMWGHRAESELGIAYHPDGTPETAIESITYNVLQDVWNVPQTEPSIYFKRALPDLQFAPQDAVRWDDLIEPDDSWDTGPDIPAWANAGDLIDEFALFGGTNYNELLQFNVGDKMYWSQGTNPNGWIDHEIVIQDINVNGDNANALLQSMFPRMEASAGVQMYIGYQWSIGEDYTYDGPYTFDPSTDHEIRLRTGGRRHAVKFIAEDGQSFRWYGFDLTGRANGRY